MNKALQRGGSGYSGGILVLPRSAVRPETRDIESIRLCSLNWMKTACARFRITTRFTPPAGEFSAIESPDPRNSQCAVVGRRHTAVPDCMTSFENFLHAEAICRTHAEPTEALLTVAGIEP